jgi:hypothetical protein
MPITIFRFSLMQRELGLRALALMTFAISAFGLCLRAVHCRSVHKTGCTKPFWSEVQSSLLNKTTEWSGVAVILAMVLVLFCRLPKTIPNTGFYQRTSHADGRYAEDFT